MSDFIEISHKKPYNRNIEYSYYTPINTKINFQMFEDYNKNLLNKPISDEIADQMNVIENMIISSDAFKMQENKPQVNQSKWQSYKIKKIPLTNLFLILNKLTYDNFDEIINESIKYNKFSLVELNQLADVFLGKCIMETKNIKLFINYFKTIIDNELWYVKTENNIVSFRDVMINTLENEYNRLTKIAGHIEDVFKNQIRDININNELDGSEDYLKKKNIILSLINLVGIFYNNKIISTSLLKNILDNLKEQYLENPHYKKIYLELWLVLWNNVASNLNTHYNDVYNMNILWLQNILRNIMNYNNYEQSYSRLISLIKLNLNIQTVNTTVETNNEVTLYDITNEISNLLTEDEYIEFKSKHNNMIDKYIIKYLLEQCNIDHTKIPNKMEQICKYLVNKDEFVSLAKNLLNNDDIVCDYPNYKKYIVNYIS